MGWELEEVETPFIAQLQSLGWQYTLLTLPQTRTKRRLAQLALLGH